MASMKQSQNYDDMLEVYSVRTKSELKCGRSKNNNDKLLVHREF